MGLGGLLFILVASAAATPTSDVAGTYHCGFNVGGGGVDRRLELGAAGEFVFTAKGCFHDLQLTGSYSMRTGWIVLRASRPGASARRVPSHMYPVRWADRIYLVSAETMLGFCDRYRRGWRGADGEASEAPAYVRETDGSRTKLSALGGVPAVPPSYKRYLTQAFVGRVTQARNGGRCVIDRGWKHGVVLHTKLKAASGAVLNVIDVRESKCVAEIWNPEGRLPKRGTALKPTWDPEP